jgi:hypothetical protein
LVSPLISLLSLDLDASSTSASCSISILPVLALVVFVPFGS